MKSLLLCVCACLLFAFSSFSQPTRIKAEKYPSLLWEITGNCLQKPSYLFGTMHVSSKMVFHLSDSFYLALRSAQVVALETNPSTWQEDFSRYDLTGETLRSNLHRYARGGNYEDAPHDYLSINSLRLPSFEKVMEAALYSNPSILNSFLYRSNSEASSDFEEDTYLDLHIFQAGRKLGKKVCGVEDFDGSMQLVKEAYADAVKDKKKSRRDYDDDLSYARLEEAYRTGNLDLLDTINKANSQSAAFDEKFLYRRNEIQATSIDSILGSGASLFVGVGAAHLPGSRGVIEILRKKGYRLRPIKMTERSSQQKEGLEKIRVPVPFSKQTASDGFYTVMVPGKLYDFGRSNSGLEMKQFADMVNGSYYMVTRVATHAAIMGLTEAQVAQTLDSVLYENIPGKILLKKPVIKNGYSGYDITNRTRRGDVQRYNIFVTPFEVLIFKMSGNGEYVRQGTEAAQFFGSIQLKEQKQEWKKWSPSAGGFDVELPHVPLAFNNDVYAAFDAATKTAFEVKRTEVHNYNFLEEDSFDLNLLEESFASSDCIARALSRQWTKVDGYPALNVRYKYKDSSLAVARFLIQGPHYYTLVANAKAENRYMDRFLASFSVKPFVYREATVQRDSVMRFSVQSPVALEKKSKLQMYPGEDEFSGNNDADDSLLDNGTYKSKVIESDSTGEKIYVSFYEPSQYFLKKEAAGTTDSTDFWKEWTIRRESVDTAQNGWVARSYELGNRRSSRLLKGKLLSREGVGYQLETQLDTLSKQSAFVTSFFESFAPFDSVRGIDIKKKKTALFFSQFFSPDSMLHKTAVKNIGEVDVDSSDFGLLKKCIEALNWKEKKYLQAKKSFVEKLSVLPNQDASDYLKRLYLKAGDTVELQYAVLRSLLGQRTAYAYQAFGQIMKTDPPVLDIGVEQEAYPSPRLRRYGRVMENNEYVVTAAGGNFLDNLADSMQLTAGIFKSLLPLVTVSEYEQPILQLMSRLVDSSLLRPEDYEAYLPKFILEAKQTLKRQLVQEKNKAIEKRKNEEETKDVDVVSGFNDFGNNKLSLYASLLLPFWDRNPQVPLVLSQLLQSSDKRLRYDAALLLLRHNRPVPVSLWAAFAAMDDYRHSLYRDLKKLGKEALFPLPYRSQAALARSKLCALNEYGKPDTLVYLQKVRMQYEDQNGLVYIFKYKGKKDDANWKFATAGLFPADSTKLFFDSQGTTKDSDEELEFTELTSTKLNAEHSEADQVEKLRKKLLYSRRKSAAQFYVEEDRYGDFGFPMMR